MPIETTCIEWAGAKTTAGYGTRRVNGKNRYVHRLTYCEAHGLSLESIEGLVVRHRCDNPRCYRIEHLELGTQADNMRDRAERGRVSRDPERTRQKRSEAQKLRFQTPVSEETRARMSAAHAGRALSEAHRSAIGAGNMGRKASNETRARLRAAWEVRKQGRQE